MESAERAKGGGSNAPLYRDPIGGLWGSVEKQM